MLTYSVINAAMIRRRKRASSIPSTAHTMNAIHSGMISRYGMVQTAHSGIRSSTGSFGAIPPDSMRFVIRYSPFPPRVSSARKIRNLRLDREVIFYESATDYYVSQRPARSAPRPNFHIEARKHVVQRIQQTEQNEP